MTKTSQDPGRREFLKDFVTGTVTVGALSAIPTTAWAFSGRGDTGADAEADALTPEDLGPTGPEPRIEYPVEGIETSFLGLAQGSTLGEWSVSHVQSKPGSVAVVLAHPNAHAIQLDVLRRGGSIQGVVETQSLALFVANGARGSDATAVEQLAAAGALGAYLRAAERRTEIPTDLISFEQRANANPSGNFRAI